MQILRSREFKTMPWKNGGGETTQIAVSPQGAGLEDFDWRVSTARISRNGPFSRFLGIDRTLAVLSGDGLRLSIDRQAPIALTAQTAPLAFAADVDVEAFLLGGPVVDLNVMTRRGRISSRVKRIELAAFVPVEAAGTETMLFCIEGVIRVETSEAVASLDSADAFLSAERGTWGLYAKADAFAYFIEFFDVGTTCR